MKHLDLRQLGAGLLAAGGPMVAISPTAAAFWIGIAFLVAGPVLMAVRQGRR